MAWAKRGAKGRKITSGGGSGSAEVVFQRARDDPEYAMSIAKNARILRLRDGSGFTVAHAVAGHPDSALAISRNAGILRLSCNGFTVAHKAAVHRKAALQIAKEPAILRLKDSYGRTVAHIVASHPEAAQELLRHRDILKLRNHINRTVLDEIEAAIRYYPYDPKVARAIAKVNASRRKLEKKMGKTSDSADIIRFDREHIH